MSTEWIKRVTSYDKHKPTHPTMSLSSSPLPRTPAKFQVMAMGNHINLPYTRDYSHVNFTRSAGLSKPVLINKVFSVKMFPIECFLDCIILMCASVLCHSLWMEPSTVTDRVYSVLKVPVEDISKQNIRATCFHSIIMPFLSQTYLGLVPVLVFSLFGNNLRKEKKTHWAILEWKEI